MIKKIQFILLFIAISVSLGLMSSTYSRYVAGTTSSIDALFAKWQILINNEDITSNSDRTINFTPTVEENDNVASNTIAPGSKGYFDIEINPSNTDVSFRYEITLDVANEYIPDLLISKYAIIEDLNENDVIETNLVENNIITNNVIFDKNTEDFSFKPFTIRVYFEWYNGEDRVMTNEDDTNVGLLAAEENIKLELKANLKFEQIFE